MDKTEQYIKMCEKAGEIQKLRSQEDYYRNWENGDFFWSTILGSAVPSRYKTGVDVVMRLLDRCSMVYCPGGLVWLPRQDQLQEMVDGNRFPHDVTHFFSQFVEHKLSCIHRCSSMEQLWLAFVMREKYNKVWDGENWVKQ